MLPGVKNHIYTAENCKVIYSGKISYLSQIFPLTVEFDKSEKGNLVVIYYNLLINTYPILCTYRLINKSLG